MKKLFLLLSVPSLILLNSCVGESKKGDVSADAVMLVPEGWVEKDLTEPGAAYSLPLAISIPDTAIALGIPELKEGPTGGTQLRVGKNFNIEILPGGGDMAAKKSQIEGDAVFKSTYIVDEPDAILYKSEIPDAGIAQYHFFAIVKIGDATYEIEDVRGEDEYTEEGVKRMLQAARSLRVKKQA